MIKEYISKNFDDALRKIGAEDFVLVFEVPKNADHGDLSTNVAMTLARQLRKSPKAIAEEILANLQYEAADVASVEIAGAGFINIKFTNDFYLKLLGLIAAKSHDYGKQTIGNGTKVNVEYVSANPTGLLHLGHGRNAAIGDTVSNLYEWLGFDVTREYYFNNSGNQMNNLAKSIYARYMQQVDSVDYPFPEDGYHGEYVKEIAVEMIDQHGNNLKDNSQENLDLFRKIGEKWCFDKILTTLSKMNISQSVFYNEDTLYSEGKIEDTIEDLRKIDLVYEKEGALWLKLTEMGLDDDRVIVKSTGEPTYRLPDIAYHREKFKRGFDIIVDVFGADHIATIPDVMAAVKALGYDTEKIKVLIHQFVTLTENGEQVKMSKRSGKSYTLDDLLDEVGPDVVRFFLIMRGISTHLEFDLALAREQSDKNPVFYLQYAHARISSLVTRAKEQSLDADECKDFSPLIANEEINLIKEIVRFEEKIKYAGLNHEPQVLAEYLRELASAFHVFYHNCRIIGEENNLALARLKLADMTRKTIKNGLSILGISAPERM